MTDQAIIQATWDTIKDPWPFGILQRREFDASEIDPAQPNVTFQNLRGSITGSYNGTKLQVDELKTPAGRKKLMDGLTQLRAVRQAIKDALPLS